MDYGEVLSKAWKIIWKHKILWLFGILAGFGSAGGNSGGNVSFTNSGRSPFSPEMNQFFNAFGRQFERIPVWVWVLVAVVFLFLFVLVIFLNTVGQIGLFSGAKEADQGTERLTFGSLFNASLTYFWRVFLLNLLFGIAIVTVFLVVLIPLVLFSVATLGIGLICLIPFICLMIPLAWVLGIILEQSIIAIVVEDIGIFAGVARGWNVVTHHIGQVLIMGLILGFGGSIVGLIFALPVTLTLLPILLAVVIGGGAVNMGLVISAILFIIYLPFLLLFTGILRSYTSTAWTLTFIRLKGENASTPDRLENNPIPPADPIIAG